VFILIAIEDTIKFHFGTSIFSQIKNQKINNWFNPNSYVYMYKNGDPQTEKEAFWGSSRWFAFLVDGWHFFKMLLVNSIILVLTLSLGYHPYVNIFVDTFAIYVIYGLVFQLFYGFVLMKNK
jgi:hypothetical protein